MSERREIMVHRSFSVVFALALLAGCSTADPSATTGSAGPDPQGLSAEERALLATLSPETLPAAPPDVSNAFSDNAKAALLGQKLFFDKSFSGALLDGDNDGGPNALGVRGETGKVACAGCHVAKAGFLDNRTLGGSISLGSGWGRRRTPSLLDVGQTKLVMWDGRHDALFNQPFGPLESGVEMNSSRLFVAERVFKVYRADYEALFGPLPPLDQAARFAPLSAAMTGCQHVDNSIPAVCDGTKHGMPGDGAEFDALTPADQKAVTRVVANVGKAIAAYERLLTCGPSRFDRWMHGEADALSTSEIRGASLFVGRAHCIDCHSGPFLSDQKFHNVGLTPATVAVVFRDLDDPGAKSGLADAKKDPLGVGGDFSDGDDGRLPKEISKEMEGAFRTPMLRCADLRPTFMHTGQLTSLKEVVQFFARGGDESGYLGKSELVPLGLDASEQADLVAFLEALHGPGPDERLLQAP